MGARDQRSIVVLTLVALVSLSIVGGLHLAEHDALHENTPCEACIAAAAPAVLGGIALDLDRHPDADVLLTRPHQDPGVTHRAIRHPARAPPSRHG